MPPDLHLHPDRLHVHAHVAAELSETLLASLRSAPDLAAFEQQRLCAEVRALARELAELSSALDHAAMAASRVEDEVATDLRRAVREPL